MEVERRIYDADIQEIEKDEGNEGGFDDFLRKYAYGNDELSNANPRDYAEELKNLKNLYSKLNRSTQNNSKWHAINYKEIVERFNGILIDVSDACLIEVGGLELILQAKDHFVYTSLFYFLVACHFKHELKNFEDQHYEFGVVGGIGSVGDVESDAELVLAAIDQYNKHKGAKLKLVRMIKVNFMFSYLLQYYITFSAMDEDTGCIATYQAAMATRYSVCVLGFLRDVDADKILSILSIKGAEEEMNDKLIHRASLLANSKCVVADESSSCSSFSSDSSSEMQLVANHLSGHKFKLE